MSVLGVTFQPVRVRVPPFSFLHRCLLLSSHFFAAVRFVLRR